MIAVIRRCVRRPGVTKKGVDSGNSIEATSDAANNSTSSHKAVVEMQAVNDESQVKPVPANSSNRSLATNMNPRADGTSNQYVGNGANISVLTNASLEKPTASEPPVRSKQVRLKSVHDAFRRQSLNTSCTFCPQSRFTSNVLTKCGLRESLLHIYLKPTQCSLPEVRSLVRCTTAPVLRPGLVIFSMTSSAKLIWSFVLMIDN